MPEIINMPRLSDTMEEGTVAKWFMKVGDIVKEGDILAEIETDKATMEFEAFHEGELLYIGVKEGETAIVDSLLAIIGEKNEDISKYINSNSIEAEVENSTETSIEKPNKDIEGSKKTQSNFEVINMPRLSDTMEEGTVAKWFMKVGDIVKEGDILAEIETDKATMEFESFYSGHLLHIGVNEGKSAKVDTVLAIIGDKEVNVEQVLGSLINSNSKEIKASIPEAKIEEIKPELETNKHSEQLKNNKLLSSKENNKRIFVSPLAKKIATERGISLSKINGSGDNGRIIKRDIENYTDNSIVKESSVSFGEESFEEFPNSQMRKTIAKRLSESKFSAPHYYLGVEFNMDNLISFRIQHNNSIDSKISFNDIIIKAAAKALIIHPEVNAKWSDDKIVQFKHVHMGVAVAVDEGLVVPVVKYANEMSLINIGQSVKDFASRARSKKLTPTEMEGSTFTISNLGMFGISEFTSIINQPNSAILSVGAIVQKPIVKEGKIVVGNTMKLTLACDHRVVDGATGSAFLTTLRNFIENPVGILL